MPVYEKRFKEDITALIFFNIKNVKSRLSYPAMQIFKRFQCRPSLRGERERDRKGKKKNRYDGIVIWLLYFNLLH